MLTTLINHQQHSIARLLNLSLSRTAPTFLLRRCSSAMASSPVTIHWYGASWTSSTASASLDARTAVLQTPLNYNFLTLQWIRCISGTANGLVRDVGSRAPRLSPYSVSYLCTMTLSCQAKIPNGRRTNSLRRRSCLMPVKRCSSDRLQYGINRPPIENVDKMSRRSTSLDILQTGRPKHPYWVFIPEFGGASHREHSILFSSMFNR